MLLPLHLFILASLLYGVIAFSVPSSAVSSIDLPHPAETIAGRWEKEPNFNPLTDSSTPNGPILGNGDLGAAISSTVGSNSVTFNLGMNQYWAMFNTEDIIPAPPKEPDFPRPMAVGGITLTLLDQTSNLSFSASQYLFNGTVMIYLSDNKSNVSYTFQAYVDSNSNWLIVDVSTNSLHPTTLSVTTYTLSDFPTRSGCTNQCNNSQIMGNYITRLAYVNTSFPIEVALITRVIGSYSLKNTTLTNTSVISLVTFNASVSSSLTIASLALTNLDVAGVNQSSPYPPAPVTKVDPLPSAQAMSIMLNLTSLSFSELQTRLDWLSYWQESCIIYLPDDDLLQNYYYGAQYLIGISAKMGKVPPGLWSGK